MKSYFEGYYFKHQKGENTLCFIVGKSNSEKFIQIITNNSSYFIPFIGNNSFSSRGIKIDIKTKDVAIKGEILYKNLTPINDDIMGIFQYFPMECKHGIVSMRHDLQGSVVLNDQVLDFDNGVGYIEKDSGVSFPKTYVWLQCNDFTQKCSVVVSVAHIPFWGFAFQGCIGVIYYNHKEYRFASYLGAKVLCCTKNSIVLQQGKLKLEVNIGFGKNFCLKAPVSGEMKRMIHETPSCPVHVKFYYQNKKLLDLYSEHASFEYELQ